LGITEQALSRLNAEVEKKEERGGEVDCKLTNGLDTKKLNRLSVSAINPN
jgi:hypothetical protein